MRLKVVAAALLSTLPLPALAQEQVEATVPCAPFEIAERFHAEKLGETRVAQGLSEDGSQILMIFAAPDGASWSVVVVNHDGVACLRAHGSDWQLRHDVPAVPEQGS